MHWIVIIACEILLVLVCGILDHFCFEGQFMNMLIANPNWLFLVVPVAVAIALLMIYLWCKIPRDDDPFDLYGPY